MGRTILFLLLLSIYFVYCSAYKKSGHFVGRSNKNPAFEIDYENDRFLLDGKPFRYISGSIHYFRIHRNLWEDRLRRVRALGLNAITFYIPWNFHEITEGNFHFDGKRDFAEFIKLAAREGLYTLLRVGPYSCGFHFDAQRDVVHFIELAAKMGLYTMVRVGPYICSEWENGGLPWWLLKREGILQRTNDPKYTSAVEKYFKVLLPKLKPLLRENGGPILMIQIENEYGSYFACDRNYTGWLRDLVKRELGNTVVLFTTDGGSEGYLKCGPIDKVFPTVDFGPMDNKDIDVAFAAQRNHTKHGPLVNSEFYPGWLVLWGQKKQSLPSNELMISSSKHMFEMGASFNYYLIHGGTNFGFWNGAEVNAPVITSYDFSAPISESGDVTPAYLMIRSWIKTLKDWENTPQDVPENNKKIAYGDIKMEHVDSLWATASDSCQESPKPRSFEQMNHAMGFMVYTTKIDKCGKVLSIPLFKDFAYIFMDSEYVDTLTHLKNENTTELKNCKDGAELSILVENQGRQTYETINDYKGILSDVLLDGEPLTVWTTCTIKLGRSFVENVEERLTERKPSEKNNKFLHGVFTGTFHAEEAADTFIDFSNWGKGVLIVNGHNMGRYWTIGPQITLYVPAPFIKQGDNRIIIIELDPNHYGCSSTSSCILPSVEKPNWKWEGVHRVNRTLKRMH